MHSAKLLTCCRTEENNNIHSRYWCVQTRSEMNRWTFLNLWRAHAIRCFRFRGRQLASEAKKLFLMSNSTRNKHTTLWKRDSIVKVGKSGCETKRTEDIWIRELTHVVMEVLHVFNSQDPEWWRRSGLKDLGTVYVCLNKFPWKQIK